MFVFFKLGFRIALVITLGSIWPLLIYVIYVGSKSATLNDIHSLPDTGIFVVAAMFLNCFYLRLYSQAVDECEFYLYVRRGARMPDFFTFHSP